MTRQRPRSSTRRCLAVGTFARPIWATTTDHHHTTRPDTTHGHYQPALYQAPYELLEVGPPTATYHHLRGEHSLTTSTLQGPMWATTTDHHRTTRPSTTHVHYEPILCPPPSDMVEFGPPLAPQPHHWGRMVMIATTHHGPCGPPTLTTTTPHALIEAPRNGKAIDAARGASRRPQARIKET